VRLVRLVVGVVEWVVYGVLGALSPADAEALDEAVVDPLA
jgi:hypothetical protein